MKTVTIDFETYYDRDYSLSKLQTDAYVLDNRFQVIGIALAVDDEEPQWFSSSSVEAYKKFLGGFDLENCAVRCHNTLFDGFILSTIFNVKPRLWMDTLAQSRMLYPYLPSHSLANMSKFFKLPPKGTEVQNMLGKRLEDISSAEMQAYSEYCLHDTWLCREIGKQMDGKTPLLNTKLIDMTIRMFTEPMFVGDLELMEKLYVDEVERKEALLQEASVDKSIIMSNDKFADMLRSYGVMPPTKISARTNKETYAFAKSDKEFLELQEHNDPQVQALVAARLGVKTTIAETRAKRFVEMTHRGPLPVYLNFWGAKTTGRYSGGNQVNWQNLPARGPSAGLRKALKAPEGYGVVVGDSSNIELRMVMALAGQTDVLAKLDSGVDLYCDFASRLFGRDITKADKAERFLGKTAMLGLQYGAGAARFVEMVRIGASTVPGVKPIDLNRAFDVVDLYRQLHPEVVELWGRCENVILPDIGNMCSLQYVDVNGWFITQREGFGRPGEPGVVYHDLKWDSAAKEWSYLMGKQRVRIFGPKVVENLCQHAAMLVVMWQTARINQRFPVKLSVHDEAVVIVPNDKLTEAKEYMEECLALAPQWCRGFIPLDCEVQTGASYGDAK